MSKKLMYSISIALILGMGAGASWADTVWEGQIQDENDDVEQQASRMYMTSSDLEFVADGNTHVGIRFTGVDVPQGSAISKAYMEFQVDELEANTVANLIIYGDLSPGGPKFNAADNTNVSDRPGTAARVAWSPEHYPTVGEKVQTVDISPVIEEIVGQPGWFRGSALILIVIDDPDNPAAGFRTVEANPGDDSALLHIEWGPAVKPTQPNPGESEIDVSRDTVLSWSPGTASVSRNVYFGTVFDDVNAASTGDQRGVLASQGQTGLSFDPGRLEFGQTYYWRVEEVNGAPDFTAFSGPVWQFSVEQLAYPITDLTATASASSAASVPENTINGSGLVGDLHGTAVADMWVSDAIPAWIQYEFDRPHRLHELWVWNSNQLIETILGYGAKEVVIEHSLNGTDWTVLAGVTELAQAPGVGGYAANNRIDFGGAAAQYVRITVNSVHGFIPQTSLSEVRFFSVPTLAALPSPASGATNVSPDVTLAWGQDGREAGSHDVYLGTDSANLSLAGNVSESSFDTLAVDLQLSQTYYWRVDEVNDVMEPSTWTGDVWSFTTADVIIIDDMESYKDEEFFEIWATWIDGFDDPANGALVGANPGTGDFSPESTIVHGGNKSLPIHYDHSAAAQSEATRSLAVSQDWTRAGVTQLVVWFHGAAGNTGQMYLKVNGTKIPYDGPAGNIALAGWQVWNIDLASLGMNLQSVRSLAVGVEGNGATGTLYVDDITLTQSAAEPIDAWRVSASTDDAEEHILDGGVMESLTSSDLELGYEGGNAAPANLQTIGCRWVGIAVPKGATITEAWVQFSADDINNPYHAQPVSLVIGGQLSPNPDTFSSALGDISSRPTTSAQVVWDIPQWMTVHAMGPEERSPDISSIIQEIVNQPDWSGEGIVLMFADNPANPSEGTREAESFNGSASDAPLLHIGFE
ncbi:MAG: discoidin domain-containing protein [Planctomycetes bacterium]|nr:discoidin domain-containing protein [Planctomycetota bacterium]